MTMDEEEEGKRSFRVKDNRRFDSDGNDREVGQASSSAAPKIGSTAVSVGEAAKTPSSSGAHGTAATNPAREAELARSEKSYADSAGGYDAPLDFSSFVISLATQALMQLGAVEPPDGVQVPVDKAAARQTIDIIAMLQQKTKGNLAPEEARMIEEILHNLRMSFLNIARR